MSNPVCVCISLCPLPTEARGDKAKWVFTWPLIFLLCITIPNCSKPRWEKLFMVTFITATLWIAVFSYLMVWLVSWGRLGRSRRGQGTWARADTTVPVCASHRPHLRQLTPHREGF